MNNVTFRVNGTEYKVGCEIYSTTTLLDYIRNYLELRGTKYMCLEGGCGACIVSVHRCHDGTTQAVNSCLVSITSCQDWNITTIEKLGNRKDGYHPLQKTLAESNGTQCGYCSPGWVMAMYSLAKNKKLTMLDIEQSFGSNICRCTGYRPILDAFKKFASDAPNKINIPDIEDLNMCSKSGEKCRKTDCENEDWCFVSKNDIKNDIEKDIIHIRLADKRDWYRVNSVADVFNIFKVKGIDSYMLVAGNTGKGVYPIDDYPKVLIDVTGISELKGYYLDQNLVIAAGNTLSKVMDIFEMVAKSSNFQYLNVLNAHLKKVAHIPVKNIATIAGNLMLKHQHPDFVSDIFVILETAGAQLTVVLQNLIKKTITMQQFLKEDMKGKIITAILLPPLNNRYKIVTYKIMPRSENAHAVVSCGYLYKLYDIKVTRCRIVYGGLSTKFIRATKTEDFLRNKELFDNKTLQDSLKVLKEELIVTQDLPEFSVRYRKHLALSLFYKGLLKLCPKSKLNSRYVSGASNIHESRGVSEGQQSFDTDPSMWPLYKPIPKIEGLIQCAGEAHYTEDLPSLPKEVFAAFVLTTIALGKIEKIDASKALELPGVIAFYTASDIPGVNSFTVIGRAINLANEEILCNGDVKYFNQPLGIIVAASTHTANKATKLVKVTYSDERKPIVDIKIAKNDPMKTSLFTTIKATKEGTDIVKIITGENIMYGQYNFCMETLVCVTYPTEEGFRTYAATQWIDTIQQVSARALNIQQNRFDVQVRRLGGAFGYKVSRETQVAVACNLVSLKLNKPCRFIQTLTTNMRAVGKRTPCATNFEVAVNSDGVIQYIKYNLYSDNGYVVNEQFLGLGIEIFNNIYNRAIWTYKSYEVVTDTPSNSWCRAPGTFEHIAMAEWVLERLSYEMNKDALQVRLANVDPAYYSDVMEITETLKANASYDERIDFVNKFNAENRWKKRGLRFTMLKWAPLGALNFDINMNIYHDDGTVSIVIGGIEMGQGINTKVTQICAYFLNIPIEKVQIKVNDSINSPNSIISGGSITTSSVGVGVQKCCEEILKRLEPVRNEMDNPTWVQLIRKAFDMNIDLQVHTFSSPDDLSKYTIFGITLAEVEIDVLTGEWNFVRVDILEDVGRSINPYIDIGQIEGGYIMGMGNWTVENLVYDPNTGELLTNRTWEYWVPQARDIPQDFRVYFRKNSYSTNSVLGAKAVGEPPTCMGVGVAFALRAAIVAARTESGLPSTEWFDIDGAYTVEKICLFSLAKIEDFKFY